MAAASSVNAQASEPFELGGQILTFLHPDEMHTAGMTWLKMQITWSRGGTTADAINVINHARAHGFNVLLSIKGIKSELAANPTQYYQDFAAFLHSVALLNPDAIESGMSRILTRNGRLASSAGRPTLKCWDKPTRLSNKPMSTSWSSAEHLPQPGILAEPAPQMAATTIFLSSRWPQQAQHKILTAPEYTTTKVSYRPPQPAAIRVGIPVTIPAIIRP